MTSLKLQYTGTLRSQQGQKGRPRKYGRVKVILTSAQMIEAAEGFCASTDPKDTRSGDCAAYRQVVGKLVPMIAEHFGVTPADITLYRRECLIFEACFIVKGTDRDTLRVFDQSGE